VNEVLTTNRVVLLGPNVDRFENDLASYLEENVQVATVRVGTSAIRLALKDRIYFSYNN